MFTILMLGGAIVNLTETVESPSIFEEIEVGVVPEKQVINRQTFYFCFPTKYFSILNFFISVIFGNKSEDVMYCMLHT